MVLKTYPNKNLYDVLKALFGTVIAKGIILLYAIWAYLFVIVKVGAYSVTLQATLMPSIHPGILITILFLLVIYTLTKNTRTIFRFAEFLYQPILVFLAIMFLFALPNMDFYELVPVSISNLEENLYTVPDICSIGGNLVLVLFFSKKLIYSGNMKNITKRVLNTVVVFSIISILSIVLSVAINGATITSKLSYPMFQAIKNVSILNTFERFDSLMTMIAVLSDFVGIYIFLQMIMLCLGWIFSYQSNEENDVYHVNTDSHVMNNSLKVYGAVLFFIACVYILLRNITQYEFETYYREIQVYLNIIFQFVVPILLGVICLVKQLGRRRREYRMEQSSMTTDVDV